MNKLILILGCMSSGKDTILRKIEEHHKFKKMNCKTIVSNTTRPMRVGEEEGVQYHFKTNEQYFNDLESGEVIEHVRYDVSVDDRPWYYYTMRKDIRLEESNYIEIVNPSGFAQLNESLGSDNIFSILIHADEDIRFERAKQRGDKEVEIRRRFKADLMDFDGVDTLVDKVFTNNGNIEIDDLVENIIEAIESEVNRWRRNLF